MGLCHDVVPFDDVIRRATELAINLSEIGPLALLGLLKKNSSNYEELQAALRKRSGCTGAKFSFSRFLSKVLKLSKKNEKQSFVTFKNLRLLWIHPQ